MAKVGISAAISSSWIATVPSMIGAAGLLPAHVEGLDFAPVAREAGDQLGDALGVDLAGIELEVPVQRADVLLEPLRFLLGREQLAEQVDRVPVDEDAAEVEDGHERVGHVGLFRLWRPPIARGAGPGKRRRSGGPPRDEYRCCRRSGAGGSSARLSVNRRLEHDAHQRLVGVLRLRDDHVLVLGDVADRGRQRGHGVAVLAVAPLEPLLHCTVALCRRRLTLTQVINCLRPVVL